MINKKYLFILFIFVHSVMLGQSVKVLHYKTKEPIKDVQVHNRDKSISLYTNIEGIVSLNDFKINELVYFSHPSFEKEKKSISQIVTDGYRVLMFDLIDLPTIVIKPPRENTHEDFSSVRIDKINSFDIQFSSPQTSADMLQKNSNILVQKSQAGGGSPIIRGFEANKILLVVDGVRMNNAIYRSGHLQNAITVDPNILESTDVFYGPGSVIYGSDALGGVIHFHTKNPMFSSNDQLLVSGNALARFGTANGENTTHVDLNLGTKKFASLTSITFSDFEDFRMGNNRSHGYEDFGEILNYVTTINGQDSMVANPDENIHQRTAFNQLNLLQKFSYQRNENLKFGLNIQSSTSSQINRFDKLNEYRNGKLRFSEWYYGPQNRLLTAFTLESKKETKLFDYFTINSSFQKIDEDRIERRYQSNILSTQNEDVFVYSLNADFFKRLSKKEVLYYGIEGTHNDVNSTAFDTDLNTNINSPGITRYPNGENRITSGAVYATLDKLISKEIIINFGARYNHFINYSEFLDTSLIGFPFNKIDFNTGAFSGSVSIKYEEENGFRGELIGSSGYRSPNVDDYGKIFENDGNLVIPNNLLRPEFVYNGELNFSKKWEKDEKEYLMVKIAGFYTVINNAIVRSDFVLNGEDSILFEGTKLNLQSNQNVSSAYIYGGSFDTRINFTPYLSFNGSVNYTIGKNVSTNSPLGHIPPVFGRLGVTFNNKRIRAQVNSQFNGWKQVKDFSPTGEDNLEEATINGSPSWLVLNAHLSVNLNSSLRLQGSVENIFDTHYKQFASGVSALGRNFSISLKASF